MNLNLENQMSSHLKIKKAIIIGAGIGGLSAALALRQSGLEVEIYERAAELQPVGAGISIMPNAIQALNRLGLHHRLRQLSVPQGEGGIRTWRGQWLLRSSTQEIEQQAGAIPILLHRVDLQNLLLETVGPQPVQLSAAFERFEQTETGVHVRFRDGRETSGDLLVGADGLRSAVRTQLFGLSDPHYSGYTSWRGVVSFDLTGLPLGEFWGPGAIFGLIPLSDGRVYWYASRKHPEHAAESPAGRKSELLDAYRGWSEPIERLIQATPETAILRTPIYDRDPIPQWSKGRITLLGDAAHPMQPYLGQGGCQAIEDAVVLGHSLRQSPLVEDALRHYEQARTVRTATIVKLARRIGRIGHLQNPLARAARDTLLRLLPARQQAKQTQWLFNFQV